MPPTRPNPGSARKRRRCPRTSRVQGLVLDEGLVLGLLELWIRRDALGRAHQLAEEFVAEEREHVALVRHWLNKYPEPTVGWDGQRKFRSEEVAPQFEQALENVLAVLAEAGGRPEHICRMTAYCSDKPASMAARKDLGPIWRRLMGRHDPAMSMIFVSALLDDPGKIELEATAVIPQ